MQCMFKSLINQTVLYVVYIKNKKSAKPYMTSQGHPYDNNLLRGGGGVLILHALKTFFTPSKSRTTMLERVNSSDTNKASAFITTYLFSTPFKKENMNGQLFGSTVLRTCCNLSACPRRNPRSTSTAALRGSMRSGDSNPFCTNKFFSC